jgi:DNA-binding NarL/FixJ family response regulator
MINVIIADDDDIFRNDLKIIIEQDKDIKVCGLASNGNSAYDLCKTEKPDIVLMDMQMPYCDGSSATYKIKQDFPNIKVLVLTTFDDKATVNKRSRRICAQRC